MTLGNNEVGKSSVSEKILLLCSGEIDFEKRDYPFAGSRTVGRRLSKISDAAMTEPEPKKTGFFGEVSFFDWVPPPIVRFVVWTEGFWHLYLSLFAIMTFGFCLKALGLPPDILLTAMPICLFAPPWILFILLIGLNRWFQSRCVSILIAWFFGLMLFWEGNGLTQGAITSALLRAWSGSHRM